MWDSYFDFYNDVVSEYRNNFEKYQMYSDQVFALITTLSNKYDIHYLSLTKRVKSIDSFQSKVKKYLYEERISKYSDIHDLCGLRIIVYYKSELSKIDKIINDNFEIIEKKIVKPSDPSSFGYQSTHYVVQLTKSRLQLTEYADFSGMIAEIQVRTILQHAWAEIEHDIGYKSNLPENDLEIERQKITKEFARTAALLDQADEYFNDIKHNYDDLKSSYERKVLNDDTTLWVNQDSVNYYIEKILLKDNIEDKIEWESMVEWRDMQLMHATTFAWNCGLKKLGDLHNAIKSYPHKVEGIIQEIPFYGNIHAIQMIYAACFYYNPEKIIYQYSTTHKVVQAAELVIEFKDKYIHGLNHEVVEQKIDMHRLLEIYRKMKHQLIVDDKEEFTKIYNEMRELQFEDFDSNKFFEEYAWVVINSGLSYHTVESVWPDLSEAFFNWDLNKLNKDRSMRHLKKAKKALNHELKLEAISETARLLFMEDWNVISKEIQDNPLKALRKFKFIGPVTVYHLAKNLGFEYAKPDRHLTNIAEICGYPDIQDLCRDISKMMTERILIVDYVLWKYSIDYPDYLNLFHRRPQITVIN